MVPRNDNVIMFDSYRERSLYGFDQRMRRRLFSVFSSRFLKDQQAYELVLNGHRYKRLRLPDSYLAAQLERNLSVFQDTGIFPQLIRVEGSNLLLEFIEGESVEQADQQVAESISSVFATIYKAEPRLVRTADIDTTRRIQTNLQFLNDVGALGHDSVLKLEKILADAVPSHVWQGYDYTDAYLKNLIRSEDGRICIIDVESIRHDYLIGSGVVKILSTWAGPHREIIFSTLRERCAPDFTEYLTYVELSFLLNWVSQAYLHGKKKILKMNLFEKLFERYSF